MIAFDRLAVAYTEALAEFGELISWHVETFSRGSPAPKPPREDRDTAGNQALFLEVSRTSRPFAPPPSPIGPAAEARAPPGLTSSDFEPVFLRADQRSSGPPRRPREGIVSGDHQAELPLPIKATRARRRAGPVAAAE